VTKALTRAEISKIENERFHWVWYMPLIPVIQELEVGES
jgi:hypothetical protein